MARPKIPTLDEYFEWSRAVLHVEIDRRTETIYESNALSALTTCQRHPFFENLAATLGAAARDYEGKTGTPLFGGSEAAPRLDLKTKPVTGTPLVLRLLGPGRGPLFSRTSFAGMHPRFIDAKQATGAISPRAMSAGLSRSKSEGDSTRLGWP